MPSTACWCIGQLRDRRFEVTVVDPTCRVHDSAPQLARKSAGEPGSLTGFVVRDPDQ